MLLYILEALSSDIFNAAQVVVSNIANGLTDCLECVVRAFIITLTNFLPVKVIRDDAGRPFLYRYYICSWGDNGPGLCIHHFIKSDPERGYHDHPWKNGLSFILAGRYEERILDLGGREARENNPPPGEIPLNRLCYTTYSRGRWCFNHLDGEESFHRVMIAEGEDAWTIFGYTSRSKTWGMIDLKGRYHTMSTSVEDKDGGWWNHVGNGWSLNNRVPLKTPVIATVDILVHVGPKVLLIKRGKEPFRDCWAFPGGRIEGDDLSLEAAALRELREETNIIPESGQLKYLTAVGNLDRDPRGFTVSHVFLCELSEIPKNVKAGDDAVDCGWFDWREEREMAFDHFEIMGKHWKLLGSSSGDKSRGCELCD